MEQLRSLLIKINQYLSGLTASQKMLIGSLAVIMLMSLFLVSQYAGNAKLKTPFKDASPERQQAIYTLLKTRMQNVGMSEGAGDVTIPADKVSEAFAIVAEGGQLTGDSNLTFESLIENQSPWLSREQNKQQMAIVKMSELSKLISRFSSIRSAQVVIDVPETSGLGRAVRKANAQATVFPNGGVLTQTQVDSIAGLIAWSVAGLSTEEVRVIDGTNGRQHKATSEDDLLLSTYFDVMVKYENKIRQQLLEHLAFIPGVMVAVTAQVDVTRHSTEENRYLPDGDGSLAMVRSEDSNSIEQENITNSAEPGVRSNQPLDVNRGAAKGTKSEQKEERTESENFAGTTRDVIHDPGGYPTKLAVSVNVPRTYVKQLLVAAAGPVADGQEPTEPTEKEITDRFLKEQKQIEQSVEHLMGIVSMNPGNAQSSAVVSLIPVDLTFPSGGPGGVGTFGGSGGRVGGGGVGGTSLLAGGLLDKAILGGLAMFAMVMMVMMVRRAGKRVPLPSPEELVGVPPALQTNSDVIGEADESEAPMTGIEIGEDDVKSQKMLEQVSDMVKESPDVAGKLLGRWIALDD